MPDRVFNVLFLCTGNSARSILAECVLNNLGDGRFRAYSAGSRPKRAVHPMAIALLESSGIPTEHLRSKSWEEFATAGAPEIDIVITVCDSVAGEVCPIWPGHPVTARSEEHTSELQSLMRISYAVFCLKKKKNLNV